MGMDPSNPHHQVMVTNSSEDHVLMINSSSNPQQQQQQSAEKKASSSVLVKPTQPDLNCPRCDSANTKFCYYNNYSLSQPRYFCKGCRRYWTQGGSLRNVPVGGGCRKSNKRPSPSSSSATSSCTSSKKTPQDHQIFTINSNPSSLPPLTYDSNDLTLAFSRVLHKQQQQQPTTTSTTMQLGFDHHHHHDHQLLLGNPTTHGSPDTSNENNNNNNNNNNGSTGFLDALRSGFLETQSGFQNFQYGFVGDQLDNQNGGGGGIDHLPYQEITSTTTTTTRTEDYFGNIKGGRDNGVAADQSKVFVNFPWHQFSTTSTGDGGNINVDAASGSVPGRDQLYWNNGFGSSWHGLVNSL